MRFFTGQSVPDDAEGIAQEVEAPVMEVNGWSGTIGQAPSGRELKGGAFKFGAQRASIGSDQSGSPTDASTPALGGTKVTGRKGHHVRPSVLV